SRRRHTRCLSDWSSDVCSSDLFKHSFLIFVDSTTTRLKAVHKLDDTNNTFRTSSALILLKVTRVIHLLHSKVLPSRKRKKNASRSEERRVGKERRIRKGRA